MDERVRGVEVDKAFSAFHRRFDEAPRVVADGVRNERRDDERGKPFAISHNGVGSLGRQVLDKGNTFENTAQLFEQSVCLRHEAVPVVAGRDDVENHTVVAFDERCIRIEVSTVARSRFA